MTKTLILASQSPRRQQLLKQVNIPFEIQATHVDESQITTEDPVQKVKQLAALKGNSLTLQETDVVLAADTVVAYQGRIFEKPTSKTEASDMISAFSGNKHDVYTGVMIRSKEKETLFASRAQVEFWPLTKDEIDWYVQTDDPYDKSGGYGIQSLGAIFVKQIIGDYYTIVGLPLSRVVRELRHFSIHTE